jgi:FAD/FMN-containing dehydrogenase
MQIDMRAMQNLVSLDVVNKVVRVQAGMRWRTLQALIDGHGLAVQTMQSYANFTVGGSVSVNCHGRYVGHGPVVNSVRALQLVMPHGEVLETGPDQHADIFYAAMGGYGGVGIITEVELALDDNYPIERSTARVPLADYPSWFRQTIAADPTVLLHNADLSAPNFDSPHCVTWRRTQKPLTETSRLRPLRASYLKEKAAIFAMTELPGGTSLRRTVVEPLQDKPAVVWRNFEASLDVAELEPPSRSSSTYVLQEYFVAEQHFVQFSAQLARVMKRMPMGTLNVSIRHSPEDTKTWMAWARGHVFSFVLFYKQGISPSAQNAVGEWTRTLIALALKFDGSYYLPYQLHATPQQFSAAYPKVDEFRRLRRELSAQKFSNALWERYAV